MSKVQFNVLAKNVDNAKALMSVGEDRIYVGLMVKSFPTEEAAIQQSRAYIEAGVRLSVGLGAADPTMWQKVANVSAEVKPPHVNQVFPAAAYTLGRLQGIGATDVIVNAVIEPTGTPGEVYIGTGPSSQQYRERVSCTFAATMLREVGVHSVKFYPIDGTKRLDELAAMVRAASDAGIKVFEPTGGIDMDNVHEIVSVCLANGAECVIPHLYTSLVDRESGETLPTYIEQLVNMKW
ncbi:MAG: KDGP aldolase [Bacilli bacterium]